MRGMGIYYKADTLVYLDGAFLKAKEARLDLFSQTLHYGLGVFEGIRAYETAEGPRLFRPRDHFNRLMETAEKSFLPLAISYEAFEEACMYLLKANKLTNAYIRPLIFGGSNMRLSASNQSHLFIGAWEWGRLLGNKSLKLTFSSIRRPDPRAFYLNGKVTGQYANAVMVTTQAQRKGFDEGIQLDAMGHVAQASGANLFVEKDEVIYTPELGHIFPGITRDTIIKLARELGVQVIEKKISPEEIMAADGIFLTGTATEVSPVKQVDGYKMKIPWEETLGYTLSQKFFHLVKREDKGSTTLI